MASLAALWEHIEDGQPLLGTRDDWMEWCGEGYPGTACYLHSTGEIAPYVQSHRCNAPPRRVAQLRCGSWIAVCDEGYSDPEELNDSDVALLELSWPVLRSAISKALGLRTATASMPSHPVSLRIGQWEPQPATAYPVWFVRPGEGRALIGLIRDILHLAGQPVIVLTPTRAAWTEETDSFIKSKSCLLVSATEVVGASEEGWVEADDWNSFLAEFSRRVGFIRGSATSNRRRRRKRAEPLAKADALERELGSEAKARVEILKHARLGENNSHQLPKLLKQDLAARAGCKPYDITRVFKARPDLDRVFCLLNNPDGLLRWWESRRVKSSACS